MLKINRGQVRNKTPFSWGLGNSKREIVIHETANTSVGANANAHHRLQRNGNTRDASWHYQVDDKEIIQSFSERLKLWHSGTHANNNAIAIEICVNSDGDYNKAVLNAVYLVQDIMKRNNIPISKVKPHEFYTGKDCPRIMLSGRKGWTFSKFINAVAKKTTPVVSSPSIKSIDQLVKEVINGVHGTGEQRRKSLGVNYNEVQSKVNRTLQNRSQATTVNYDRLVQETLQGKHGNGVTREKALGKHYNEVQKRINARYK